MGEKRLWTFFGLRVVCTPSNLRVVIAREKQICTALLAGNRDQIRRFLADA
ncbi:MAG: hypothetical protein HY594_02235 [Candidatus Omnitrophica bacterium]|nr:hypothetical protein [Candidatus Omnitrophota bacterium]